MNYIITASGKIFDYKNVEKNVVDLYDVAHSLARITRYLGHTNVPVSVAEHTVHVYKFVLNDGGSEKELKMALLHDAAEAYVGDMPSPLKAMMPEFAAFEERVQRHIYRQFGIEYYTQIEEARVKKADMNALYYETRAKPFVNAERALLDLYEAYFYDK